MLRTVFIVQIVQKEKILRLLPEAGTIAGRR